MVSSNTVVIFVHMFGYTPSLCGYLKTGVRSAMPYHKAIDYLGWENIGEILIFSMDKPGELQQTAGPEQARALADQL